MSAKRLTFLFTAICILALLFTVACDELGTEDEDSIYTVTFNLTFPSYEELNDLPVTAYLWESVDDDLPYVSEQTLISGTSASITLDEVDEGVYAILVDVSTDGSVSSDVIEKGDIFWGVLDVSINSDKTISITEDYWQRFHSLMFGIQGIPAGHTGEIIAAGILPDSAEWLDIEANVIWGAYTKIYSDNALLAPAPIDWESEEQWMADSLAYAEYDLFMLLDVDGQTGDYDGDGPINIITPGDFYDVYDFNFQSGTDIDGPYLISATFTPISFEGITLTVNYELPEEPILASFDSVMAKIELWHDLNDDEPARAAISPATFPTGALTVYDVAEGTYHILVTIGDNDYQDEDTTMYEGDHGFLGWGGLDVVINADKTINILPNWWQWAKDIGIGVRGIPAGNDGEAVLIGLFANDGDPMNFDDEENFLMNGMGVVYNNAVLVAMHPARWYDEQYDFELESGNYDIMVLVDQDFDPEEFNYQDTTDEHMMYTPYSIGEPVWVGDYTHDAVNDNIQILTGSFSEMVGITGAISCSSYTGGNIAVFFFEDNPLSYPLNDTLLGPPISFDVLESASETYEMACLPDYYGFVVGVWDADSSGFEGDSTGQGGGPNEGDYLGIYGTFDEPDTVTVGISVVSDIDFEINTIFDDSLFGGR